MSNDEMAKPSHFRYIDPNDTRIAGFVLKRVPCLKEK